MKWHNSFLRRNIDSLIGSLDDSLWRPRTRIRSAPQNSYSCVDTSRYSKDYVLRFAAAICFTFPCRQNYVDTACCELGDRRKYCSKQKALKCCKQRKRRCFRLLAQNQTWMESVRGTGTMTILDALDKEKIWCWKVLSSEYFDIKKSRCYLIGSTKPI